MVQVDRRWALFSAFKIGGMDAIASAIDRESRDPFVRLHQVIGSLRYMGADCLGKSQVTPQASRIKRIDLFEAIRTLLDTRCIPAPSYDGQLDPAPKGRHGSLDKALGPPVPAIAGPHDRDPVNSIRQHTPHQYTMSIFRG
jgi:hypothetical protein